MGIIRSLRAEKISQTFKNKGIDNFSEWRERARLKGIIPNSNIPLKKTKYLAFLIGLTLGDGNICWFPRTECLRLVLGTDKPELAKYAYDIVKVVFDKYPSFIKRKTSNCVNITLYQKNLSSRLGIPIGARGRLSIFLADWIWEERTYLLSALSGLFEAEGSFCVHEKTCTYNFCFSNNNITLLNEVEKALRLLGYNPERRINAVRLRRKAEALSFRDLISFRTYPDI